MSRSSANSCHRALDICGTVGLKNDTPLSVGRPLAETLSLMAIDERVRRPTATLLLIAKNV